MKLDIFDAHMHSCHVQNFPVASDGFYLSCASAPKDWQSLLEEVRPQFRIFLGLHPMEIPLRKGDRQDVLKQLKKLIISHPGAGIGECGLDRRIYRRIPRLLQEAVLIEQIHLAVQYSRPFNLHQVKASGALAEVLEKEKPEVPFVIHGFKEKEETARRYLSLGAYLSVGPGRHWKDDSFRQLFRSLPRDRILLESDWPYTDGPYENAMNTLSAAAADTLGIDTGELWELIRRNGKVFTD